MEGLEKVGQRNWELLDWVHPGHFQRLAWNSKQGGLIWIHWLGQTSCVLPQTQQKWPLPLGLSHRLHSCQRTHVQVQSSSPGEILQSSNLLVYVCLVRQSINCEGLLFSKIQRESGWTISNENEWRNHPAWQRVRLSSPNASTCRLRKESIPAACQQA